MSLTQTTELQTALSSIEGLSSNDLLQVIRAAQSKMKQKEQQEIAEARIQIQAIANRMGMSVKDIIGGIKDTTKQPVPARYQSPDGTHTWSGRGMQPKWVKAHLATPGTTIQQLEIARH